MGAKKILEEGEQLVDDQILIENFDQSPAVLNSNPQIVGQKAVGLRYIPKKWRPQSAIITTKAFVSWQLFEKQGKERLVAEIAADVFDIARSWEQEYPQKGIILRSSAVSESLRERGLLHSRALTADFSGERIREAIRGIYQDAAQLLGAGGIAIIIQPYLPGRIGHLSNERRVSKTQNHWMWEQGGASYYSDRFNSQRDSPPDPNIALSVRDDSELIRKFRSIGRWCTALGKGPAHIEWSLSDDRLWLLQLDFEDEAPDDGVDPAKLIRDSDGIPSVPCSPGGPLREAQLDGALTGWKKLDNVRILADHHRAPYPRLCWISGAMIREPGFSRHQLQEEIGRVTNGRAVCRTDCNSSAIEDLNLPRTDSASPFKAVQFIYETLEKFEARGVESKDVCFIIHKFIPSVSAAWAFAEPNSQIVRVDSLWGVPDGLQYLPHDSFEFDNQRGEKSSERLRYKPAFIQENTDGSWKEIKVLRKGARHNSLGKQSLTEVSVVTKAIADSMGAPVQIMWFCRIPSSMDIGCNLPWYIIKDSSYKYPRRENISPQRPRIRVRNIEDIENILNESAHNIVIVLEPEVDFFRKDEDFLKKIIDISKKDNLPVELHGSSLCHAYYLLDRSGVTVILTDESKYRRIRGRRIFGKLVRDSIPGHIKRHGEQVRLAKIGRGEARAALLVKLMEEIQEVKAAQSPDEVKAEIADVHEVVRSLCAATGIEWAEVENIAEEKRAKRGSFQENVVLLETSWPTSAYSEDSPTRLIPLRNLAQTTVSGDTVHLSYAALFADGADATIVLQSGGRIKISLDEVGVRIVELPEEELNESQLKLPF